MRELIAAGIWTNTLKQEIVARNGSVQGITAIPADVQERYKTSWEIPQKVLVDMAAGRGAFICQSQSLNLFVAEPNYAKLTSMHVDAWKKGLKTGCYYLRTKAPISAQKFTVDPRLMAAIENQGAAAGPVHEAEDDEDSDTGDEEDEAAPPPETREEKMSKSLSEYREKLAKAKAAALAGEECTMCSA
jgi:ribonucleotide reductase alpha subunit